MTILARAFWVRIMSTSTVTAPMIWTRFKPEPRHNQATRKAKITSDGDHGSTSPVGRTNESYERIASCQQ